MSARRSWRDRLAQLERPLVLVGLALVAAHLVDLSISGPDTTLAGVVAVLAAILGVAALQPRVSRVTRAGLALPLGAAIAVIGALAHVLDLFTSGPRWSDLTGVAFAVGGLLLVAAGIAAIAAPAQSGPARPVSRRMLHVAAWLAGAVIIAQFVVLPLFATLVTTHAVRRPVDDGALRAAHRTVRIRPPGDGRLAAWYVPPRNGATVLVVHGSGSDRSRVAAQAELVARHGFGVLSLDLPGHGASDGHAHLLGGNAQPALRAAIDWLVRRPEVDPRRLAGFGMSLGGEVLLEAAARDARIRAVISDGAERAADDVQLGIEDGLARAVGAVRDTMLSAVSGTREPPPLLGMIARIAPRPVLLIAAGERPYEIPANRAYRRVIGRTAELWTLPEAGHTGGIRARPAEYERRVTAFLNAALRG